MILSKIRTRNLVFASRSRYRFLFFFLTSSSQMFCISKKLDQMIKQNQKIMKQLKNDELISSKPLRAYIKEFSTNADLLMIIEHELKMNQAAFIRKRARQKLVNTIAQKKNSIIVNDVSHNLLMRSQKKIKRMQTRDCQMKAARQKKIYYTTRS